LCASAGRGPNWHVTAVTACEWYGSCEIGDLKEVVMYSILYIIGAIVVIIVVLRLLGLY
jgi:hypothetical protein